MKLTTAIVAVLFGFILLEASVGQLIVESSLEQAAAQEVDDDPFTIRTVAPAPSFDASPAVLGFLVGGLLIIAGAVAFVSPGPAVVFSCAALIAGILGTLEDGTSPLVFLGLPLPVVVLSIATAIVTRDDEELAQELANKQALARYR